MAVIALLVFGAIFGIAAWLQFDKTDGGQIAVVRNGGPFDNNNIRQVIQPASSLTWTGWWSSTHKYPAQQRFYTITADPNAGDKTGVDVEQIPTSDGVEVGIQGTVYFTLNRDPATLKSFDNKYGTRTYKVTSGTGADATTEFKNCLGRRGRFLRVPRSDHPAGHQQRPPPTDRKLPLRRAPGLLRTRAERKQPPGRRGRIWKKQLQHCQDPELGEQISPG